MEENFFVNPRLITDSSTLAPGRVSWRSPSNIAIVKYWGKHGRQLPRNPSMSFTLDVAYTETHLSYSARKGADEGLALTFLYDGQPNEPFAERVRAFLNSLMDIFPFLRQLNLTIDTKNSFPHSAGIASSASAMSALALCLCTLEDRLFMDLPDDDVFRRKASYIARLGSGSACRSIYAKAAVWGQVGTLEDASEQYAVSAQDLLHPTFQDLQDTILLVDQSEKQVSSRAGHELMDQNPYAEVRFNQARRHMLQLLSALRQGDWEAFARITEQEALTLHALMMSSAPPYILMAPHSLAIIRRVQDFRRETAIPLCFSLDAGPNIHLLYPKEQTDKVMSFVREQLLPYCENGEFISDCVGLGPIELGVE